MKAKVYFYEVSYTSIFVGKCAKSFPTKEERDAYYNKWLQPVGWGDDDSVYGVRFKDDSFYVDEDEADLWAQEGYEVIYPDYY